VHFNYLTQGQKTLGIYPGSPSYNKKTLRDPACERSFNFAAESRFHQHNLFLLDKLKVLN
jgi:hypothetical protein